MATSSIHDFAAHRHAPRAVNLTDNLGEATAPAIFALRGCPADLTAIRRILDSVPDHLHPLVAEAASNRNIVPREVVTILLQEIGYPALERHLGKEIAANLISRFLEPGVPTKRDFQRRPYLVSNR